MRNITKVSRELGVSRTKVYKEIKTLKIQSVKNGKNNFIRDDDFYRIKHHIEAENEQQGNTSKRIKDVLERDRSMINGLGYGNHSCKNRSLPILCNNIHFKL